MGAVTAAAHCAATSLSTLVVMTFLANLVLGKVKKILTVPWALGAPVESTIRAGVIDIRFLPQPLAELSGPGVDRIDLDRPAASAHAAVHAQLLGTWHGSNTVESRPVWALHAQS